MSEFTITENFVELVLNLHVLLDNKADKVAAWFNTRNPNFGDVTPMWLIKSGRIKKVEQFVEARLEES